MDNFTPTDLAERKATNLIHDIPGTPIYEILKYFEVNAGNGWAKSKGYEIKTKIKSHWRWKVITNICGYSNEWWIF